MLILHIHGERRIKLNRIIHDESRIHFKKLQG
jgi:hypothetical protein